MAIQLHQKKYERQCLGMDRWRKSHDIGLSKANGWGTWWWETGVGKTYAACMLVNKILSMDNSSTIYIVVPGDELRTQWKSATNSYITSEFLNSIKIHTIHEMEHLGYTVLCTFLIVDEVHEFLTDERLRLFGTYTRPKYCLGLTATWEDHKGRHKKLENIIPVVDRIDQTEALKEGFISKFIEYNLGIDLTGEEAIAYKKLTEIITTNLSKFGRGGLDLASKCLSGDKTKNLTGFQISTIYASHNGWKKDMDLTDTTNQKIFEIWSPSKILGYASNAMEAIRKRKDILYSAERKIDAANNIVFKFDTLKTICFSQSTMFASKLGYTINNNHRQLTQRDEEICVVYHSKLNTIVTINEKGKQVKKGKTKLRKEAIDAIRTGKARIISTASSLDRGFDVKDIRLGITTSGTQNPTQHKQRNGRVVRIESYEEDISVLIINVYVRNTKDQEWLDKRQSKSNNVVYWVDNLNDINYIAKPVKYDIPA